MLGALLGIRRRYRSGDVRKVDANKRARGVAWNSSSFDLVVYCLLTRDNIIDNY